MDDFGSISPKEAYNDLGIMRLAARISELSKAGVPIIRKMETSKNRYGDSVSYMRYSKAV